jgi:ABC-type branched-subunit amino acid transport system ATPase component
MILKIDNVTKNFGGVTAIKETSFSVAPKEIFGLIGPNGAGKTTMFNIITGNYTPSSGQVIFRNEAINGLKPHHIVRKGIARTFQNIRLFSSMNPSQNSKYSLFASFSASSKAASWSTCSSMSCEAVLKSAKKTIKNQIFGILG